MGQKFVPVISSTGKQLMPTTNRKADRLIARGRAVRRFDRGLFYIQLTDREDGYTQPIAVGIDPGSKKEALTVKSEAHTYLNVQADAVTWVGDAVEKRRMMRRGRRYRKTPYRKCRPNRRLNQTFLSPVTHARWGWKLRLCQWLARRYPITVFVVEDVKARTKKNARKWNKSFSPLEVGKQWFYAELRKLATVTLKQGFDTFTERNRLGLRKIKDKMSDKFEAHCVDSWTLANMEVGGHTEPENTRIIYLVPLRFHRRELHRMNPQKGGNRPPYGGTMSLGFKRGSWVKHSKYGLCYVGGVLKDRLSLHSLETGNRLCQNAKPQKCQFLCTSSWRVRKAIVKTRKGKALTSTAVKTA